MKRQFALNDSLTPAPSHEWARGTESHCVSFI